MMTEFDTNQTQFSADQPLFQDVTIPEIAVKHEEETEVKPNPKKKFIVIGAGIFGFLFLLLILLVVTRKKPEAEEVLVALPSPSPVIADNNPLRLRVENLKEELDAADPANQLLVFPPINMELYLDKIKN
ncbi:MAG: hypothetical protein GW762_05735 [Candidatus Pacebacteria bacterium]|nr:hypothetical protein [Candidatus Paceibacterota bacterium]PIR63494.1 MAG: hypothetical protein COU64_04165 [Candidatus Pacebacteria bacterium CG10_big_fil_rev_8_21_14_0_10_40_26]